MATLVMAKDEGRRGKGRKSMSASSPVPFLSSRSRRDVDLGMKISERQMI